MFGDVPNTVNVVNQDIWAYGFKLSNLKLSSGHFELVLTHSFESTGNALNRLNIHIFKSVAIVGHNDDVCFNAQNWLVRL